MFQEGWFEVAPGIKLFERHLLTPSPPRARVIVLHGYGDHCDRYSWVMEQFQNAGMATYAYDQRGHGRSPGRRGYVARFDELPDDLDIFLKRVTEDSDPSAPLFVFGHSMGGMVLARWAATRQPDVRGLIFSSPFLAFSDEVPAALIALTPYVAALAPWMPVSQVDNSGLSRDPEVQRRTDADPLSYHGKVAAHTAREFHRTIRIIEKEMPRITVPMLVIHGCCDRIVGPSGSKALFEKAGAADKELKLFEDAYHEIYNDLDKERYMQTVIDWISARLQSV